MIIITIIIIITKTLTIIYTTKFLLTLGAHSITASAPKEWDSLPTEIRSIASYDSFKQKLKTFLFRKAFYL